MALLAAIRQNVERLSWPRRGHLKVRASLRIRDGIRVYTKRVLRLMRAHALAPALLPTPQARQRAAAPDHHQGAEPDVGDLDATQVTNVRDGKVRLCGVAEQRNAEFLAST